MHHRTPSTFAIYVIPLILILLCVPAHAQSGSVTSVLSIDCGGGAAGSFVADTDYSGGVTTSVTHEIDKTAAPGPAPQAVYQSIRYGNFTYVIPGLTAGAAYTVRLHFAEQYWTAAGKRVFDVSINGTQVLPDFDIFKSAGGQDIAYVKPFLVYADRTGRIVIVFDSVVNYAQINGIEILSTAGASSTASSTGSSSGTAAAVVSTDPRLNTTISLTNDGHNLYATAAPATGKQQVVQIAPDGSSVTTLYPGLVSPNGITTNGSQLYWVDPNSGSETETEVFSAPKSGNVAPTVILDSSSYTGTGFIVDGEGLTTDGSRLYWSDAVQGRVGDLNFDGAGLTFFGSRWGGFFGPAEHSDCLAYSSGIVYMLDDGDAAINDPPQVVTIPSAGGSFTVLHAGTPFVNPRALVVVENMVYIADSGALKIWMLPTAGGTPTALPTTASLKGPTAITYMNGALYVGDHDPTANTGTINRIPVSTPVH